MINLDHLTPGPWHPLTVSGDDRTRMQSWAHPDGCPARCRLGRILLAAREFGETFPAITADLPAGKYRLRWTARGIDVQHADGTDVSGQRPTPPELVNLTDAQAEALAEVANEALGAYHHLDLCGCDQWPASCASGYTPGHWDTGAWYSAMPALLAAWERARVAELETAAVPPTLYLAEYEGAAPELFTSEQAARDCCDDYAKAEARGRCWDWQKPDADGVLTQTWVSDLDDRPTGGTGGTVTPMVPQGAEQAAAEPVPTDSRSAFMQLGRTTPQAVTVIFDSQPPIVGTYNGFHTGWRDERTALFDLKVAFPRPAKSSPAPEPCDIPHPDNPERGCVLTIGHRLDIDHQDADGESWPWPTRY